MDLVRIDINRIQEIRVSLAVKHVESVAVEVEVMVLPLMFEYACRLALAHPAGVVGKIDLAGDDRRGLEHGGNGWQERRLSATSGLSRVGSLDRLSHDC